MLSHVAVLHNKVDDVEVVKNEGVRSIRVWIRGVCAEGNLREDRGDKRGVVGDQVEHGMIGTVVHRVEADLELNLLVGNRHRFNIDRDEMQVVYVMESIDESKVGNRCRGVIGNRGCDICQIQWR